MPRRRWSPKAKREPLSPGLRHFFERGCPYGETGPDGAPEWIVEDLLGVHLHAARWREHADEILPAWIAEHPGSRPYGWWAYGAAPEPRLILVGASRALGADGVFWRERFGVLPLAAGLEDVTVESQPAFLRRVGQLTPGERRRLRAGDFRPERWGGPDAEVHGCFYCGEHAAIDQEEDELPANATNTEQSRPRYENATPEPPDIANKIVEGPHNKTAASKGPKDSSDVYSGKLGT